MIWIASEFCDEHRAALDWLNQMADETAQFFGVEIELLRINDSPAAPQFNVVCKPNDWGINRTTSSRQSDRYRGKSLGNASHEVLWTAFRAFLTAQKSALRPHKPSRDHWYSFSIGTSRAHTNALIITKEDKIGVELNINSDDSKPLYYELLAQKDGLEAVVGEPLDWREMPDKKSSRVCLFKSVDPYDESDWPAQFAWLQDKLERFDRAFRPACSNRGAGSE